MLQKDSELKQSIANVQNQIWQVASLIVSGPCECMIQLSESTIQLLSSVYLCPELNEHNIIIQFTLSHLPESPQLLIIPMSTFTQLVSVINGKPVISMNNDLLQEQHSLLEAFAQGISLGLQSVVKKSIRLNSYSVLYQNSVVPKNLEYSQKIFMSSAVIHSEEVRGKIVWLFDDEVAQHFFDTSPNSENEIFSTKPTSRHKQQMSHPSHAQSLEMLLDIPLDIHVELGRVKMLINEILNLGTGSVLEVNKSIEQPVDILVNGKLVARGEVVVVEDNFGVRITEILNPRERLTKLGGSV